MVLSLALHSFLSLMVWLVLYWTFKGPLQISAVLSLWKSLFSPVFCLMNSRCLCIPFLLALSPQLREFAMFHLSHPSMFLGLETLDNHRIHFICFPSHTDHCPSLLDTQCLENCHFHIYVFLFYLVVSGVTVDPVLVTASWPEVQVFICILYY